MKKHLSILLLAFSLMVTFCACKKEDTVTKPTYPIVGLWIGTYEIPATEGNSGTYYYSLDLKSDSTLLIQSQGADGNTYYGKGTWALTGTAFTATTTTMNLSQTGAVQNLTATYSKNDGTLTDGLAATVGYDYEVTFKLTRIN